MDTPPREKKASSMHPRQLHARLKMQMESDLDAEMSHPAVERMDETLVHTNAIKPVADDFDDDDLD